MIKIFEVDDKEKILNNESAKMKGFKFESSGNLKVEGVKGYVFWFNAEEDFYKDMLFKDKGIKEITGKKKEEVLSAFDRIEEEKMAGVGNLFD